MTYLTTNELVNLLGDNCQDPKILMDGETYLAIGFDEYVSDGRVELELEHLSGDHAQDVTLDVAKIDLDEPMWEVA